MAFAKTVPETIGSITGLASSSSYSSDVYDVRDAVAAEIELVISASSTPDPTQGNVTVEVYSAPDGVTPGNEPIFATVIYPSTTSYRVQVPVNVIAARYICVVVSNNMKDASGVGVTADLTINASKTTV